MPQFRRALVATLLVLAPAPPLLAQAPGQATAQAPGQAPGQARPQMPPQPPRRAGLANPSALFCVERLRGSFEIEREAAGERGICVLRDGRRMDAWALYRAYHRNADELEPAEERLPPGGMHLAE